MIDVNGPYGDAPREHSRLTDREFEEVLGVPAPALSANLALLMPGMVEVPFVDWRLEADPVTGRDVRVPAPRTARIYTFVPMKIFHLMLAGRERVLKLKRMSEESGEEASENSGEYLDWLIEMTHAVWALTEPWMTRDTYESGLSMDQITELFESFFGESMRRFAERSRFQQATRSQ